MRVNTPNGFVSVGTQWLRVETAAAVLGIEQSEVLRRVARGEIGSKRSQGGETLVSTRDVDAARTDTPKESPRRTQRLLSDELWAWVNAKVRLHDADVCDAIERYGQAETDDEGDAILADLEEQRRSELVEDEQ